jgi:hypothetical protein
VKEISLRMAYKLWVRFEESRVRAHEEYGRKMQCLQCVDVVGKL